MMDANAQKSTIKFLEDALAAVKSGKATGFTGVLLAPGVQSVSRNGGPKDTMHYMLSFVLHAMMDELAAAVREQQQGRPSLVRAGMLPPLPGLNGQ